MPAADFQFDDREVEMELTKLVTLVLDIAIRIGTNGQVQSLQDALNQAIDCAALQAEAERLARSIGLNTLLAQAAGRTVRAECDREKMRALNSIIGSINGIGVGWEAMQFDQIGHAVDTNGNRRPETIQMISVPDTIDGRFRVIVRDRMGGVWQGFNLNP